MWLQAVTTTVILVLVSIASKMSLDATVERSQATELLRSALNWRDISLQDEETVTRLQHAVMAATFLQAARLACRDADLERTSGIDVSRLSRSIDTTVCESRDALATRQRSSSTTWR